MRKAAILLTILPALCLSQPLTPPGGAITLPASQPSTANSNVDVIDFTQPLEIRRDTRELVLNGLAYNKHNLDAVIMTMYWQALDLRSSSYQATALVKRYDSDMLIINLPAKIYRNVEFPIDLLISIRATGNASTLKIEYMLETTSDLGQENLDTLYESVKKQIETQFRDHEIRKVQVSNFNKSGTPETLFEYLSWCALNTEKPHWMTTEQEIRQILGPPTSSKEVIGQKILSYEEEDSDGYTRRIANLYFDADRNLEKTTFTEF